jgi:hypothetical protein
MGLMFCIDEFPCQAVHADDGQTAHAVGCQTQSLSGWTDSLPLRLSLSGFLFMEGDDAQPPPPAIITAFSGSELA